ncbi:NADPH-dependent FMN reductase [Bombilactobacillus thymidiniphilus]|uniref:NAD(P)H-dependent oxidoreductase n=1 Tax=Bombilactobacillus thymidiniphilus TaxID=2923363 RepID=A0ABY4PCA7_9LACO|nr:NAD(P)H-dependent oxidoreductase [Bombilactobacillus thymidiniphilus]UQS83403.1 NAD(P)H-dependent oxidoreductase [Bombilactobacillus thymidiniphilus]
MTKTIGILVGSLRKKSFSKVVGKEMSTMFPADFTTKFIEIGDLPLFNQDFEDGDLQEPESYQRFRQEVKNVDAILFVTPEYNRSVPAVLKNAIDVGSRPYGKSVWNGKPAAIVSLSPGAPGAFGANHHLRQSLVFLNMPTLQQPEAYLGNVTNFINEDGTITNRDTKNFLKSIVDAFVDLIQRY